MVTERVRTQVVKLTKDSLQMVNYMEKESINGIAVNGKETDMLEIT